MAYPDRTSDEEPDDKLRALGRAIACELLQLGYRPSPKSGQVFLKGHPSRIVAPAVWDAMKEVLAGAKP